MAPSGPSKSKTSASLKQGSLGFTSSKRTSSLNSVGKEKKRGRTKITAPSAGKSRLDSSSDEIDVEDIELVASEDEPESEAKETQDASHTLRTSARKSGTQATQKSIRSGILRPKDGAENSNKAPLKTVEGSEKPELLPNDPKWRKHYAFVREKMGYMQTIHGEGQNRINEILRVFDLSFEYGPCIGVSRLERWERAKALGLNPPVEVRDILSTRQGATQPGFSQSVFNEEV